MRNVLSSVFKVPLPPLNAEIEQLIQRVRASNMTYVGIPKLRRIAQCVEMVKGARLNGVLLEAGVALGGSAILIAKLKEPETPLWLFDVFGMIPAPGEKDGIDAHTRYEEIVSGKSGGLAGNRYYGYEDNLIRTVKNNFTNLGINPDESHVHFNAGLYEHTLKVDRPVALAHVDCDWHDSVSVCIERIFPKLVIGGIMIFDDYRSYSGCARAVDAFLSKNKDVRVLFREGSLAFMRRR
jgi:O-methyltransferase